MTGAINILSDPIYVMLVSGSYIPDPDLHSVTGDVGNNEVVGAQYSSGGKLLINKTLLQDDSNDKASFDADDLIWSGASITASGALLYRSGSPAWLIGYIDFGSNKSTTAADFFIRWNSNGIIELT